MILARLYASRSTIFRITSITRAINLPSCFFFFFFYRDYRTDGFRLSCSTKESSSPPFSSPSIFTRRYPLTKICALMHFFERTLCTLQNIRLRYFHLETHKKLTALNTYFEPTAIKSDRFTSVRAAEIICSFAQKKGGIAATRLIERLRNFPFTAEIPLYSPQRASGFLIESLAESFVPPRGYSCV